MNHSHYSIIVATIGLINQLKINTIVEKNGQIKKQTNKDI